MAPNDEAQTRRPRLPSEIRNKEVREKTLSRQRSEKAKASKAFKKQRKREEDADPSLKVKRLAENVPNTIDNTKEFQEGIVRIDDDADREVFEEEAVDEFASFFNGERSPKICVTTCMRPSERMKSFAKDFASIFPTAEVRNRQTFTIQEIVGFCKQKNYTDLAVIHEDKKQDGINSLTMIHLPDGPTAYFKLSSVRLSNQIRGGARASAHMPEVILNNFNTRLGHTIGRFFVSLFPAVPEFEGRQVVTFHNQRDFLFVRRHRYVFENQKKVELQEMGPRFTLKLKWLQKGTFDKVQGDYIWNFNQKMETSRRKFFL